jgi:hypothetical protein
MRYFVVAVMLATLAGCVSSKDVNPMQKVGAENVFVIDKVSGPGPVVPSGVVPDNLALATKGSKPFANSLLPGWPDRHTVAGLNDGRYGNGNSWIGFTDPEMAGINFGKKLKVARVAWGRDNSNESDRDRCGGTYVLYRTLAKTPDATLPINGDPNTGWEKMGTVDSINSNLRFEFSLSLKGQPVSMTGFMVSMQNGNCIDEIELYGDIAKK